MYPNSVCYLALKKKQKITNVHIIAFFKKFSLQSIPKVLHTLTKLVQ